MAEELVAYAMGMFSLVYTISIIISGGALIWFNTKSGKKWLKSL